MSHSTAFSNNQPAQDLLAKADQMAKGEFNYPYSNENLAIDDLLERIGGDATAHRVDRLAKAIGNANPAHNKALFQNAIERLAYDKNGEKVPAAEFSKNLYAIFGAVLTGHPVTSKTIDEARGLANAASARISSVDDEAAVRSEDEALAQAKTIPLIR